MPSSGHLSMTWSSYSSYVLCLVRTHAQPNRCPTILQVAYQRILQLTYVDELLLALKTLFIKLFEPFLATFVASLHVTGVAKHSSSTDTSTSWSFQKAFDGWDAVFDKLLRGLEDKAAQVCPPHSPLCHTRFESLSRTDAHVFHIQPVLPLTLRRLQKMQTLVRPFELFHIHLITNLSKCASAPSQSSAEVQDEEQIARNVQALKNRLRGRGGQSGRRGRGRIDVGSGRESLPGSEQVFVFRSLILGLTFPSFQHRDHAHVKTQVPSESTTQMG